MKFLQFVAGFLLLAVFLQGASAERQFQLSHEDEVMNMVENELREHPVGSVAASQDPLGLHSMGKVVKAKIIPSHTAEPTMRFREEPTTMQMQQPATVPHHEEEGQQEMENVDTSNMTPDEYMRFAQRRGFFKKIGKGLKKVGKFIKKGVKKLGGFLGKTIKKGAKGVAAMAGAAAAAVKPAVDESSSASAADVEDCVACRYVWLQVELKVGNEQIEENIYDAFTSTCIEAQKAPIFYPACEDMFDDVYGMIGDYMDGYTVNQICEGAKLCR